MQPMSHAGDTKMFDLSSRTRIEVTGKDRAALLHNLCTNDVRSLLPGQGCEAFFTNVQGKIVGHAFLYCHPDAIVIDTVPGQAESLLPHIDRYVFREDVALRDRTSERGAWFVVGERAEDMVRDLTGIAIPNGRLAHVAARLADSDAPWKFVYFHHPAYSSGPHGPHPLMQWPFAEWGADAVFQGHDHNYERVRVDDLPYFVSGLGGLGPYGFPRETPGSEFRYSASSGAMRVIADEANVWFEFIALDPLGDPSGLKIDSFEMAHAVPEPAIAPAAMLTLLLYVVARRKRSRRG